MKSIVLCADDYGQNSAVSQAIVELFEKKRLSATSCLVTSPEWPLLSRQLLPFKGRVDLGLHFNLTEGMPLSPLFIEHYGERFPSISRLIIDAYCRKMNKQAIRAELEAQLEQLISHLGQAPNFIDGHQHIHQLPVIRDVVIDVWKEQLQKHQVYIRCTNTPFVYFQWKKSAYIKSLIIQLCGASELKKALVRWAIPHNGSFGGVYQFSESAEYPRIFLKILQSVEHNGLIMCHPGRESVDAKDTIVKARIHEYHYFSSDQFQQDCASNNVKISRFK